ncbi:MAG: hypothetical protein ABW352_01410 [Polyangiales bacterium]
MAMTMQRHGRLMLAVLHDRAPSDDEWGRWLGLAAERVGKDLRAMFEVHGSVGPDARQRQAMMPLLPKLDPRTAVLSNSLVVRGVVTAVSWLGIPNAAFGAEQHAAAALYLELTQAELALALERLPMLRRAAGVRERRQSLRNV